jgi:conjugal transfer pilus assembly protein TraB
MAKFDYRAWLDDRWRSLDPKYKKYVMGGVLLIGLLAVLFVGVSKSPTKKPPPAAKTTRSLFGEKGNMSQFAVSRVSSQLDQMERENKELRDKVERLSDKKTAAPALDLGKMQAEVAKQLQQELAKLEKHEKPETEKKPVEGQKKGTEKVESGKRGASGTAARTGQYPGASDKKPPHPAAAKSGGPGVPVASTALEIKVVSASSESKERMQVKDEKKKSEPEIETFLPAGSIFSGTLITGLDVSCGKSSKKDPFPVLLRVKKEAILPNMYRADVRECFLIAAGWGDLGSERAYLRAERLSCIREDGKAIETKIDMYAVGEDGKAGLRGRVVSKTGALLSRALLAGFMQGFSQIFSKQPVLQIGTGAAQKEAPFQSMLSKDAMQSAGLSGTGSALERLSKYYMDMAKDIFPVIEIDAGRAVDFVLVTGKSLKLQTRKSTAAGL